MILPHALQNGLDRPVYQVTSASFDDEDSREDNGYIVEPFGQHSTSPREDNKNEELGKRPTQPLAQTPWQNAASDLDGACATEGNDGLGVHVRASNTRTHRMPIKRVHSTGESLDLLPTERSEYSRMDVINEDARTQKEVCGKDRSRTIGDDAEGGMGVLKVSPAQLLELASSPISPSVPTSTRILREAHQLDSSQTTRNHEKLFTPDSLSDHGLDSAVETKHSRKRSGSALVSPSARMDILPPPIALPAKDTFSSEIPLSASRTVSTPLMKRTSSNNKPGGLTQTSITQSKSGKSIPNPLELDMPKFAVKSSRTDEALPSPMPSAMPLPPLSIPTYLHLELSSKRPSPLYIYHPATSDFPYESSEVKIERLLNFLLLPPQLEQVLWFGALACLDAWLYSFTILPLRFLKAFYILCLSWGRKLNLEVRMLGVFIYAGLGRMWQRRRSYPVVNLQEATKDSLSGQGIPNTPKTSIPTAVAAPPTPQFQFPSLSDNPGAAHSHPEPERKRQHSMGQRHRKANSLPSALSPDHKADLLKGLLILISCVILMYFDASMMYHSIRGQAAIKLYVIYNVLEVGTPGQVFLQSRLTRLTGLRPTPFGSWPRCARMPVLKRSSRTKTRRTK